MIDRKTGSVEAEVPRAQRLAFEKNFDVEFHQKELLKLALKFRHKSVIINTQFGLVDGQTVIRRKTMVAMGDALLRLLSIQQEFDFRTAVKYQTNRHLANKFDALNLQQYISIKPNAIKSQITKGDVIEAIIGAIYLDQGIEQARTFFRRHIAF